MTNEGKRDDFYKLCGLRASLRRSIREQMLDIATLQRIGRRHVQIGVAVKPIIARLNQFIKEDREDLAEVQKEIDEYQPRMF